MTRTVLVLWDIDHTLIQTGGVGREVFADAFEQATGQPMRGMADPSGLTEPMIFDRTLALHDIVESGAYFETFADSQASGYLARAEQMRERGRVLPGAVESLRAFHEQPEIISSVLTGNTRASALAKLQIFGLDVYLDLDCGGFGDDDPDRAALVRIAWQRAEREHQHRFGAEDTAIIGDTPNDVTAARANGAYAIGVASGKSTIDELGKAGADVVLRSLAKLSEVRAAIDGMAVRRDGE